MHWICFTLILTFASDSKSLTGEEAVTRFFDYFRAEHPRGIPIANFKEPMELYSPLELVPVTIFDGKVFGHSKLEFKDVVIDFLSMTGTANVFAPRIELYGDYSWPGVYYTSEGFINATLFNVTASSNFSMSVSQNYSLQVDEVHISHEKEDLKLNVTNLIWEHKMMLNTGAVHIFFDEIILEIFRQLKPFLISEVNREVSKFISSLPPASSFMTPEEMDQIFTDEDKTQAFAILLKRLFIYLGLEPLYLPDKKSKVIGVHFNAFDMVLHGVSTVKRIDSLFAVYHDKKIYLESSMTYPKLLLFYKIKMASAGIMNFDIFEKNQLNDVTVNIKLIFDPSQEVPPKITYFDIHVGSFGKIRSRKRNFWGRVIKFFTSVEDGILREIVNALQGPLKKILQSELNRLNIEEELLRLLEQKQ